MKLSIWHTHKEIINTSTPLLGEGDKV